jgi:hypothetical protein
MAVIANSIKSISWNADGGCTLIFGCTLTFEGQIDATMVSTLSVTMPRPEVVEQLKRALQKPKTAVSNVVIMRRRRR